jgi:hypothetical protein
VFAKEEYTPDNAGNVKAVKFSYGVAPTPANVTYMLDKDYRLTNERRTDGAGGVSFNISYTYDAANNRTKKQDGGVVTTYSYSARNTLEKAESPGQVVTYQYDNRGNRTVRIAGAQRTTSTYDIESRLTGLDDGASVRSFRYDHFGDRVDWTDAGTLVTEVWDGPMILSQTRGGARTRFTEAPDGSVWSQSTPRFFAFNAADTLNILTGAAPPSEQGRFIATAFGEVKSASFDPAATILKVRGNRQWVTDPSGLILAGGGSFYDRETGRRMDDVFRSTLSPGPEPEGLAGRDPIALGNGYVHVAGGPVNGLLAAGGGPGEPSKIPSGGPDTSDSDFVAFDFSSDEAKWHRARFVYRTQGFRCDDLCNPWIGPSLTDWTIRVGGGDPSGRPRS